MASIKKIINTLDYWLNTNSEMGVVCIPEFIIKNIIKELQELENNKNN